MKFIFWGPNVFICGILASLKQEAARTTRGCLRTAAVLLAVSLPIRQIRPFHDDESVVALSDSRELTKSGKAFALSVRRKISLSLISHADALLGLAS